MSQNGMDRPCSRPEPLCQGLAVCSAGLVPKQMSTGDRTILGRISKRGNRYLRTMIMQGAASSA